MTRQETSVEANAGADEQPKRLDGFWPHLGPVLFLTLIFLINFTGRIIFSPLLPTIEKELQISHSQAGFFFFLISLGYFVGLLGSGFLASRFTHKITIVVSTGGVGLALVAVASTNSLWAIRLGLSGLGFAAGLYMPSAVATITSLIDRRHWGKAIAVHEVAPNVAFFAAPFLAELFLKWASWRIALGLLGTTSLILSLVFARSGKGGDFPGESPTSNAVRILLSAPSFWLMLLLFGLGISSTLGIFAMLPLYL
ncbi:MAG TPA: MFS transporter, partial [Candidatus Binatia bacterium]|nr:MFS transporter [Candidatus Binatia bacterium]